MSTEILVDTVTTTTDSCQMVATETTLQVTAATSLTIRLQPTRLIPLYLHAALSMNRNRLFFQS